MIFNKENSNKVSRQNYNSMVLQKCSATRVFLIAFHEIPPVMALSCLLMPFLRVLTHAMG